VLPDFIANRGLYPELASRLQPESDVVSDTAGNPIVAGYPCDGGKAHAGRPADHIEYRGHGRNTANSLDIGPEIVRHLSPARRSIVVGILRANTRPPSCILADGHPVPDFQR
jgi:hypothetical protein